MDGLARNAGLGGYFLDGDGRRANSKLVPCGGEDEVAGTGLAGKWSEWGMWRARNGQLVSHTYEYACRNKRRSEPNWRRPRATDEWAALFILIGISFLRDRRSPRFLLVFGYRSPRPTGNGSARQLEGVADGRG